MTAYYNEFDPFAAAWLRELITAGHIAPGDVDDRSILDVRPSDLVGYTQCHFFAGIGVWSYALRRAGWPDNRPVWTGSCPCQPFSAAGKGGGFDDERHLWPAWYHLIGERRPPKIFGEQVASKNADPWVDLVQADLETLGYAFGAVPFPSAGVGAPHIRDRTYWTGRLDDARSARLAGRQHSGPSTRSQSAERMSAPRDGTESGRLADAAGFGSSTGSREPSIRHGAGQHQRQGVSGRLADTDGWHASAERQRRSGEQRQQSEDCGIGGMADPVSGQLSQEGRGSLRRVGQSRVGQASGPAGPINGFWRDADWLHCRDYKWRPVEPGTFPLAHGAPARVGRLRGYGNAINAEAAVAFIEAATAHEVVDLDAERLRLTGAFA